MKKQWIALGLLLALLLPLVCAGAEVIPAYGQGQIGYQAVVLCQSLTVRESPNASSKAVLTLKAGALFATESFTDGWLDCFPTENEGRAGWVKADYVAVDPAWYQTGAATAVRAWDDDSAYQVALLDAGERYPILKAEGEWLCIGLRGAAGWIHDPQGAAAARDAALYPANFGEIAQATLTAPDGSAYALADPAALAQLGELLSHCHARYASGCPFDGKLTLTLANGRAMTLDMASDSCAVFRTAKGDYYSYGDHLPHEPDSSSDASRIFWALFGLNNNELYPN